MSANRFQDFQSIVEAMEGDFEKFYDKEVGAAGTRVRKHLQELAKLCKKFVMMLPQSKMLVKKHLANKETVYVNKNRVKYVIVVQSGRLI